MADGRKCCHRSMRGRNNTIQEEEEERLTNPGVAVNQARALRVAELINDYRTLLMHISQQNVQVPADEFNEEGYKVIRDGLAAAQALMSSNYNPCATPAHAGNVEVEKAELRRYADISLLQFSREPSQALT